MWVNRFDEAKIEDSEAGTTEIGHAPVVNVESDGVDKVTGHTFYSIYLEPVNGVTLYMCLEQEEMKRIVDCYNSSTQNTQKGGTNDISDKQLISYGLPRAAIILEYLLESQHNNWEGWEPSQILVIDLLLKDMRKMQFDIDTNSDEATI